MAMRSILMSILLTAGVKNTPVALGFQISTHAKHHDTLSNMMGKKSVTGSAHSFIDHRPLLTKSSSGLYSTADNSNEEGVATPTPSKLDVGALVKYGSSIAIQMSLVFGLTKGLDLTLAATGASLPFPAVFALFYALSLKSRVFNPLNNERPGLKAASTKTKASGFNDRVMPSFTPPGFLFPIAWILVNAPLRAYASALVYQATGALACPAILAFLFHLSVGDVWNTINNAEQRYGASATTVLGVWASAAYASLMYSQVDPLAGKLLGGTLIWLTLASSLIISTWRINPDDNGNLDPLYPVEGKAKTQFAWFQDRAKD